MALAMEYGTNKAGKGYAGLDLATSGEITDSTPVILTFDEGGMYLLFVAEYRISNGAFRGQRVISIKAPESEVFGTTAVNRGTLYSSSDSGVTLTYNNDSTLSIAQASSAYAVRYALYKAF